MMNKKMLLGAATALSMVVGSTAAFAGPSDKVVYGTRVFGTNVNTTINQQNQFPGNLAVAVADGLRSLLPADARGARYEQESNVAGNTETATPTVSAAFTLSGTV